MIILCNYKAGFSSLNNQSIRHSNIYSFIGRNHFKYLSNRFFFKNLQQNRKFTNIILAKPSNVNKTNQREQWEKIIYLKSYFHDGSITGFEQTCNKISILIESSEISDSIDAANLELSENKTLKGKLHLENNLEIRLDNQPILEKLQMLADSASILDFELQDNQIEFFIEWTNYPPKEEITRYTAIKIKAMKIYWENNFKHAHT